MSLFARLLAAKVAPATPVEPPAAPAVAPPPVVVLPEAPPPVRTSAPVRFTGPCRCVSAVTGRQCALLAGHAGPHRHGRTTFVAVAAPGQSRFPRREALEEAGSSRLGSPHPVVHGGAS